MKRAIMLLALLAVAASFAAMASSAKPGSTGAASPQLADKAPVSEVQAIKREFVANGTIPGIAMDSKGNTLVIFRESGQTVYSWSYRPKGGTWTSPAVIPNGPQLTRVTYSANIVVDSEDRFQCLWEEATEAAVYGSYKVGEGWRNVGRQVGPGAYDMVSGLAIRSNDEVLSVDTRIVGISKDIWLHRKGKSDSAFGSPSNMTGDFEASTQGSIAVDAKDQIWMVHKSDYPHNPSPATVDILVICLSCWDKNNRRVDIDPTEDWIFLSDVAGWSFMPMVAVNSDGKVMSTWVYAVGGSDYMSRLYDPATKVLGPAINVNTGISRAPWHTFWSSLVAHGKDFYFAPLNPGRVLFLMKYDEAASRWDQVAQISDGSVDIHNMYSGNDQLVIAWATNDEPPQLYVTTVDVTPLSKTLTIAAGTGGTTNPAPGVYNYNSGSSVTVTAVPSSGYAFSNWSGDASGTNATITVTVAANMSITANFVRMPLLTIQSSAGGTTNPVPGEYRYLSGTNVTVTAAPNALYELTSWSGDASGNAASITVLVDGDKTVRANYALQPVLTVQSGPGGTTNPAPGTYPRNAGTQVSVQAVPAAAYRFVNWTGDASGTANPTTVTVTRNMTVTSNFALKVQSMLNVNAVKRTERSFFSARYLNVVTWEANSLNADYGVNISAQRLYRKARTAPNTAWTLIKTFDNSTILVYEDRYVERDSDYVYAVSCVDAYGNESLFY